MTKPTGPELSHAVAERVMGYRPELIEMFGPAWHPHDSHDQTATVLLALDPARFGQCLYTHFQNSGQFPTTEAINEGDLCAAVALLGCETLLRCALDSV